jgi:hypothetical protein
MGKHALYIGGISDFGYHQPNAGSHAFDSLHPA